ncbi:MAG: hypothetical protein H6679_02705 [Epsilonproteobacteria bacterium]|nr:hypothetical protein [Campylobacterota bacterium]
MNVMITFFVQAFFLLSLSLIATIFIFFMLAKFLGPYFGLKIESDSIYAQILKHLKQ